MAAFSENFGVFHDFTEKHRKSPKCVIERTISVRTVISDWLASCFGNDGLVLTLRTQKCTEGHRTEESIEEKSSKSVPTRGS